jgi:hypothetical protein
MAVFLETSVFGQGVLVLPLGKGGFRIVYVPNVFYVLLDLATVQYISKYQCWHIRVVQNLSSYLHF